MQQGVYVHIPFCVSRCLYCDFYSTTLLAQREAYTEALLHEIALRRNEWQKADTIYFGGGTPSLLSIRQIERLLQAIGTEQAIEVTLEANPGDLNATMLRELRQIGINRLSIGVQSFQDDLLRRIGRRHTAAEAQQAIETALETGFDNLSVDLMYGLPEQTIPQWKADIEQLLTYDIPHISCYCLSYEQGTALSEQLQNGSIAPQDEDEMNNMYDLLCDTLQRHGYEHYEVSNFARPSFRSRHNSSYWADVPYIGLGAAAHSYRVTQQDTGIIRRTRSWNPSNLNAYMSAIAAGQLPSQTETIDDEAHHIEQIMLGLRTASGIAKVLLNEDELQTAEQLTAQGLLRDTGTHLIATRTGLHLLNRIIEDLI